MTRWIVALCVVAGVTMSWTRSQAAVDPRGPIDNAGMKIQVDKEGVQTIDYPFVNTCKKPTPWQGQWIWMSDNAPDRGWFRKEVTLDEAPKEVLAWISADMKYRLWINGKLASRGPADIGRDFAGGTTGKWFYDFRDLTPLFHKGRNVIAAEVFRRGPGGVSRGKGGFLFEAQADALTIKSDATWRGIRSNGGIAGWQSPEFDDAAWGTAQVVPNAWEPLVASEIPPLMEARYPVLRIEGLPDNKTFTKDGSFNVVFDRVLSGFPTIKVKGGKGAHLTLKAHSSAAFVLNGGEESLEMPFMSEIVPAFRVELTNVTEPVEIVDVGAYFTSQPVQYRGAFECSDEKLNRIWKVSRWAVQICLQTHHLDSPNHQEPISDPGDYLIEAMVNNYAFAQPWLTRQDVRKFAWLLKDEKYHNFHTSYSIGWLQMLMDYYDFTGDKALVEEMAPYVHELMDTYASWRGKNGIISEAPNYMFMDWVTIAGFGCHHPPAVIGQGYLTAFYYHGMKMASRVAELTGDSSRVATYGQRRREIAEAFNRELWNAGKGLYRDGKPNQTSVKPYRWMPADKDIETFSPHVNLLAVLYDLAPKDRQTAIVEKVLEEKPLNTQPWFMHWVFQSIDHAGLFDKYGTSQMRRWKIVEETQSFREMWNGGDLSHGWCSTPLVQMSGRVLGVQPTLPAFKTMSIRPMLCDLKFARGVVPTPQGNVAVAWSRTEETLELSVTIPAGSSADVAIPVGMSKAPVITANGKPFWNGDAPAGAVEGIGLPRKVGSSVETRLAPGEYKFVATLGSRAFVFETQNEESTGNAEKPAVESRTVGAILLNLKTSADSTAAFESDLIKESLVQVGRDSCVSVVEHKPLHAGGGSNADAIRNGTTRNGSGTDGTKDNGRTFRGYGAGSTLTFKLNTGKNKAGYDISKIVTFAGHSDDRAGQSYVVSVSFVASPDQFVKLIDAAVKSAGGSSEIAISPREGSLLQTGSGQKASGVAAVRFEFRDTGAGFNVYREFCIAGQPTTAP